MIDQGELFDIPSPCKRICEVNNRGYCKGCFRSRTERLNWLKYTDFQRQLIINLCEKRRLKVLQAKLNPAGEEEEDELIPQPDLFDTADPQPEPERQAAAPELPPEESVPSTEKTPLAEIAADTTSTSPEKTQTSLFDENTAGKDTAAAAGPAVEKEEVTDKGKSHAGKAARKRKGNDDQLDMFS